MYGTYRQRHANTPPPCRAPPRRAGRRWRREHTPITAGGLAAATEATACSDINNTTSTGTGGAHARRLHSRATPCLQLKTGRPPPSLRPTRARTQPPRSRCVPHARTAPREPQRTRRRRTSRSHRRQEDSSTRTRAALRAAHAAPARPAPPPVAAPPIPDTTDERRRTMTKRCCVPTRAQSRRHRSMGYGGTGRPPRQRGDRLLFLPCERGSHSRTVVVTTNKAPSQPCALTTWPVKDEPATFNKHGTRPLLLHLQGPFYCSAERERKAMSRIRQSRNLQ